MNHAADRLRRPGANGAATACQAYGVSKVYGRRDTAVHALRDVTLRIPEGAFTAIMGPSGSGKSTLLHCLAALDTPTAGHVYLGRTELTALSRRQQAQVRRDRIGFVFQAFNLVPTLDAIENITLPQLLAGRRPDREWLDYVVTRIGLGDRLRHRPSELSGGQQQRVALARALAGRPEVIFADEPTGNLDTTASREMLGLLRDAVREFGQTVVTVTHDPSISAYADQVLFFSDGQVVDHAQRPDVEQVVQRLQYLDGSEVGRNGHADVSTATQPELHASPQPDRQHTMRSRRRRQPDETTPGRPMVGTDDEVEVARQERWLRRIREQFELEQESARQRREEARAQADDWSTQPPPEPSMPEHPSPSRPHDDDGWLPPERSWTSSGERRNGYYDRPPESFHAPPADPAPWSRPEAASQPAQTYRPPDTDPWEVDHGGDHHHPEVYRPPDDREPLDVPEVDSTRDWEPRDADTRDWEPRTADTRDWEAWDAGTHAATNGDLGMHHAASNGAWRHEEPASDNGDRDAADDHAAQDADPWRNVWDANAGVDVAEVWSPAFDRSWPAYEPGYEVDAPAPEAVEEPPDTPEPDVPAAPYRDTPADEADTDPVRGSDPSDTSTAPPPPAPPIEAAPPAPVTPPAPPPRSVPPQQPPRSVERPHDQEEDDVPPALASLRNPRRQDDPLEALQSLQAQLDRLSGAGRRATRATQRYRGPTDEDTGRNGRH